MRSKATVREGLFPGCMELCWILPGIDGMVLESNSIYGIYTTVKTSTGRTQNKSLFVRRLVDLLRML